jgi:hypothetical protein
VGALILLDKFSTQSFRTAWLLMNTPISMSRASSVGAFAAEIRALDCQNFAQWFRFLLRDATA